MSKFAIDRRLRLPLVCVAALMVGCSGGEARKSKHMEKGQTFLAAGNLDKARIEFRNALQVAPNDTEVRFENGVVDERLGNKREAGQFYQGAIDVNADNIPARVALARLYLLTGAPNEALEALKPSLDRHPDDPGLLTMRAAARKTLKDLPEAQADAERAVGLVPNSDDAVSVLAGIYRDGGQIDKAISLLQDTAKQLPQNTTVRLELADLYARNKQEAQAEALLVELIDLKPDQKSHRLRLAQYYAQLNRVDDAERVLREGLKALPAERDMKIALIDFLAARRSREAAEKELLSFIAQDPKDYQMRFALARFYAAGNESTKAEAVYSGVITDAGSNGSGMAARDHLAELRSQQGDIVGAQNLLTEVLAKVPRDNDALILNANLALKQKDPKTAIADLRSVLRDQPNAVGVMRVLARAHVANQEPALAEETLRRAMDVNPADVATRLDLSRLLINLGKFDQAKPVIEEAIRQEPGNLDARSAQFQIAASSKNLASAKAAADAMVAANPKSALGYYYKGNVAEMEQRPDDAVRLYSSALEQQADAAEPLQAITRVLVKQKRLPEALKRLDDVAAHYPRSAIALNIKGEALANQKRGADARSAFQAAIAREPKSFPAYLNLAYEQINEQDKNGAIATLQGAIEQVTYPEKLETTLGVLYQEAGRPEEAIRVYDTALRRNPQSDVIANNLAMLLVDARQDPASLDRARQLAARFSTSEDPQLLDTYGWVLYKHGEANNAVAALQTASTKAPSLAVLWYHLGMAQLLSGRTAAARDSLSRSLKSGQTFSGIDEARAALDKLARQGASDTARS